MAGNEPKLHYGSDQLRALLLDLQRDHAAENPFALFEVIERSQEWQLPLPEWAVDALKSVLAAYLTGKAPGKVGKGNSPLGRFRKRAVIEVRRQTYQSIMNWMRDPRQYKAMPRNVIQRWFIKEIQHEPKSSERAIELSVEALSSTFAACTAETLLEARYFDPLGKVEDELRDYFSRRLVVRDLGVAETSWVPQYLNYFGPPSPPPQHVAELLKLWDEPQKE